MSPRDRMERLRRSMLAIVALYNADSDLTLDIRVVPKSQEKAKPKHVA